MALSYITPAGRAALWTYKYKGEDRSLLFKYALSPLAEACVARLTPRWLAPNSITLLGLALQLCAYLLLLRASADFATPSPAWVVAAAAATLFAYSTLDNMDGKQARRVGASSPLGLLFDHGCDAVNTGMIGTLAFAMAITASGGAEAGSLRLPFAIWAVLATAFFMNTWEEFHIREFILPVVNGPSEGLATTVAMLVATAALGTAVWHAPPPPALAPLLPALRPAIALLRAAAGVPAERPLHMAELAILATVAAFAAVSLINIYTVAAFHAARRARARTYLAAAGDTHPMLLLLLACFAWLLEPTLCAAATAHGQLWLLTAGSIFAGFTSCLMVSHVCSQDYRPTLLPIAVFALAPALAAARASPALAPLLAALLPAAALRAATPPALLWLAFVVGAGHLVVFFAAAVATIAEELDIDVFAVTKQVARKAALEAAAAAAVAAPREAPPTRTRLPEDAASLPSPQPRRRRGSPSPAPAPRR